MKRWPTLLAVTVAVHWTAASSARLGAPAAPSLLQDKQQQPWLVGVATVAPTPPMGVNMAFTTPPPYMASGYMMPPTTPMNSVWGGVPGSTTPRVNGVYNSVFGSTLPPTIASPPGNATPTTAAPVWNPWESTTSTTPSSEITTTSTIAPCYWITDEDGVVRPARCLRLEDGNVTCWIRNASFAMNATQFGAPCEQPVLKECPALNLDVANSFHYTVERTGNRSGSSMTIRCSDDASPYGLAYPVETWGEFFFEGPHSLTAHCNNGTWTSINSSDTNLSTISGRPIGFSCTSREQIGALKDMVHLTQWTKQKLEEADKIDFTWIDATALLRKNSLKHAHEHSDLLIKRIKEGDVPTSSDMRIVSDSMKANSVVARGEAPSADTCKDFSQHFLWQVNPSGQQLEAGGVKYGFANNIPEQDPERNYPTSKDVKLSQPIKFHCTYTAQKTPIGIDPMTKEMTFHFRDGCYCESEWKGLCPYQLSLPTSYQYFGFSTLDQKAIAPAAGALCWYWSDPVHPEWGYIRNSLGYAYQAPAKNATDLTNSFNKLQQEAQEAFRKAQDAQRKLLRGQTSR